MHIMLFLNFFILYTFIILLNLQSFEYLRVAASGEIRDPKSLYSSEDPILQILTLEEFNGSVLKKKKGFFVEFYSDWCGYCQTFASVFKDFALNVSSWNSVVEVVTVNCAFHESTDLCREADIAHYPTIKYFKYNSRSMTDGKKVEELFRQVQKGWKSSANSMTITLAAIVVLDWNRQLPAEWPNLSPLKLNQPIRPIKNEVSYIGIIFIRDGRNKGDKIVGVQVILDLADVDHVQVFLAPKSHQYFQQHMSQETPTPSLLIFKREMNKHTVLFASRNAMTRSEMTGRLGDLKIPEETVLDNSTTTSTTPLPEVTKTTADVSNINRYQVHITDLTSGLSYMLRQEIPLKKLIIGDTMKALKEFLKILSKEEHGSPIPTDTVWVACKGSEPKYRGYPCSLWIILHTLTVEAYLKDGDAEGFDSLEILEAIHGYVKNFFGCTECAKNFERGAVKLPKVVKTPEDVVLWLWKSHNKANRFIPPHDPAFPKGQFPPESLCSPCHKNHDIPDIEEGHWDDEEVLKFLLNFYTDIQRPEEFESSINAYVSAALNRHNGFSIFYILLLFVVVFCFKL